MRACIPYGIYWSTPFAKWQGSLANMNALPLAAQVGKQALAARSFDLDRIDLSILGITNIQKGAFYGLPYVTGMMGIDRVAGPTVQQACATSVRALQMAAQEVQCGTAGCALLLMADRQSNGPVVPLDERKVIARRAAMEITPGAITNLGIGIPAGIPSVAAEEGVSDLISLSIESGVNGCIPAQLGDFALAYNAESIIEQSSQFDFYDGGGLDASFLGLAQTDAQGNVNVSKFNGRPVGCGGFINITRTTKKLVFCGAFTAGGLEVDIADGKLLIRKEGKSRKFIDTVEQVTFNGRDAALRKQTVLFITERAVFRLTADGLELTEVAPGVDIERDVLAHMSFKPGMYNVKLMDAGIFQPSWGGLSAAMGVR